MKTVRRLALAAVMLGAAATTAGATGKRIAFVSCPMVRNTFIPCWLSVHQGELYYLGPQGDLQAEFYPPQLGRKILVEAELSDEPKVCGGVVLKEVVASVLPIQDQSCNTILPAEGFADPPNERGPGPSGVRGGAPPEPRPQAAPPAPPQPPFKPAEYTARFNADTSRMWRPAQAAVRQAATYATQTKAEAIEVTGYRSSIKLSDGGTYVEDKSIAQERAQVIAEALRTLGIPEATKVRINWRTRPEGGRGDHGDAEARRVVIRVIPGRA